jgi:hypothetical protein
MMSSFRPRSTREAQAGLYYAAGTVAQANLVVAAFRWRYELTASAALTTAWLVLGPVSGAAITAGLAALIATGACWPRGRRFLVARAWCVVTPHRVRAGCAQAWIHSRNGKIPAVFLTRRQPFGERVYLWCRAGTSADDLSSARALLAAACWADDIRVTRHLRYAHLVTLDVIRRRRLGAAGRPVRVAGAGAAGTSLAVLPLTEPADDGGCATTPPDDDVPRRQIST